MVPGPSSLSDEASRHGPVFWDVLNQNLCRLNLRVLWDIKPHNNILTGPSTGYCHRTATKVYSFVREHHNEMAL